MRVTNPWLLPILPMAVLFGCVSDPVFDDVRPCVTEFTGPTGGPGGLATGPNGRLWFSEQVDDQVGNLDPATGVVEELPVPPGTSPHFVTRGPDDAIWFTGLSDVVGRIDPATNELELFRDGITPGSVPHAILADPDGGGLYFTEQEGGRIARFDIATETVTEFDEGLPPNSRPHGLAFSPDGAFLWVALQAAHKIGRFDRALETFDILVDFSPGSGPHDIRLGPDGRTLFVTLQGSSKLGTYDPATGVTHEYDTPIPPPTVPDLVPAPKLIDVIPSPTSNAVWITTFMANILLRFDVATEALTPVSCGITPGGGTLEITVGPDGKLWITQPLGLRLGRIDE